MTEDYKELRTLKPEGHLPYYMDQELRPIFKSPWTREEIFDLGGQYLNRLNHDLKDAGILVADAKLDRAYFELSGTDRVCPISFAVGMVTNEPETKFEVVERAYRILVNDIITKFSKPKCLLIFRQPLML